MRMGIISHQVLHRSTAKVSNRVKTCAVVTAEEEIESWMWKRRNGKRLRTEEGRSESTHS